jgi:hypothetical protein
MAGVKALRKVILGRETTAGTATDGTTIWRGTGVFTDNLETVFTEEDIGYLSGVDRAYIPKAEASFSMDETPATFEQLPHILEAGVMTATPAANGVGSSGYVYTYNFPTTEARTLKTYTIEGGDNQQAEEFAYGFVESFTISGAAGEAVQMSADWLGRQIATTTYTTDATIPTVEEILFSKCTFAIDTAGGSYGGTAKTNTLLGMTLDVDTGWQAVYTGSGQIYFSFAKSTMPEVTCEVTMEHDTTSVAEVAAWRAGTARRLQFSFAGSTLTTAGTTPSYTTKVLVINLTGKWESFDGLDEQDGNDTLTGTFRARYDSTATSFAQIIVCNESATLP